LPFLKTDHLTLPPTDRGVRHWPPPSFIAKNPSYNVCIVSGWDGISIAGYLSQRRSPFDRLRTGLGSTSLTTDETGDIVSEVRYLPYGEERWADGTTPTDFTFTGQRNEAGFGLISLPNACILLVKENSYENI